MDHVGPFTFNGVRFALGALSLAPLWLWRRRRGRIPGAGGTPRDALRAGAALGTVLFVAASFQQIGIVYTTAGKAGFITGLYVVVVPLLAGLGGHRVGGRGWSGAVVAAVGLYVLSVHERFAISIGDALVLIGAFGWAAHVLLISRWAGRIDVIELAMLQFATCAAFSMAAAAALEPLAVRPILAAAVPILYGGVASVGVAYTLQVVAQRDARPTTAGILLSLESVFAALGGWIVRGETLSLRALVGCAVMLGGVVLTQIGPHPFEERPGGP